MNKGGKNLKRVALSFSGGKDSCLALYRLLNEQVEVVTLLTTVWKDKQETVAHGERLDLMTEQARQLNIPITFIETTFATYQDDFEQTLQAVKQKFAIDTVAFGDIYLEGHREWGENLADSVGLKAYYPLWSKQELVGALLNEFVDLGFKARIVKVDETKLPVEWVGSELDHTLVQALIERQSKEVCAMGESGEYHTFVYDGPIFNAPVI